MPEKGISADDIVQLDGWINERGCGGRTMCSIMLLFGNGGDQSGFRNRS